MGVQDGISGVVRGALAEAGAIAGAEAPPEQLDLAALLPSRFDEGSAQLEKVREHVSRGHRARGAGRPEGAQNIATRQVRDFVRKVFGDPMIESARMTMHTPKSLAEELSCTLFEAARFLEDIRKDLRPYFYARLGPVGEDGRPVPFLQLNFGETAGGNDLRAPWERDPEVAASIAKDGGNQQVREDDARVSHNGKSHETPSD